MYSIVTRRSLHNRPTVLVTRGFISNITKSSSTNLSSSSSSSCLSSGSRTAFISSTQPPINLHNLSQRSQTQLPLLSLSRYNHHPIQNMRQISSATSANNQKGKKGSFAKKAFVATATASTTFAAYYFATVVLFGTAAVANGDAAVADSDGTGSLFRAETKKDDIYGIEYVGFDSYPGIKFDDDSGVATKEFKAASAEMVSKALDAAGLEETGILKGVAATTEDRGGSGNDVTLHPQHVHRIGLGNACPVYGCSFLPLDVHYDEEVKAQLENLRKKKDSSSEEEEEVSDDIRSSAVGSELLLKSSGSANAATLTLIGYKGGRLEDQVNQDRALALVPYLYSNINSSSNGKDTTTSRPVARLIGAFDGHAKFGEKVSEYVVKTLPALLGSKLVEHEAAISEESGSEADEQQKKNLEVGKILQDTFLELDATSPAEPSGGCTASAVLQIGTKLYVANAGDSRSFIAVHVPSQTSSEGSGSDEEVGTTTIVYGTREDKPDLTTERERVEHMGGTVYLPNGFLETGKGTTRVLYNDPMTGSRSGLAMSRSIGDWDAGEVGVIPDPLIAILDINEIKKKVLANHNEACNDGTDEVEIDPSGESSPSTKAQCLTENDIKVFAVSATDGLLDYLPAQAIVNHVAKGLYSKTNTDNEEADASAKSAAPMLACEDLIYAAAQGWQEDKGGRYRDDIAIAVADLKLE